MYKIRLPKNSNVIVESSWVLFWRECLLTRWGFRGLWHILPDYAFSWSVFILICCLSSSSFFADKLFCERSRIFIASFFFLLCSYHFHHNDTDNNGEDDENQHWPTCHVPFHWFSCEFNVYQEDYVSPTGSCTVLFMVIWTYFMLPQQQRRKTAFTQVTRSAATLGCVKIFTAVTEQIMKSKPAGSTACRGFLYQ